MFINCFYYEKFEIEYIVGALRELATTLLSN